MTKLTFLVLSDVTPNRGTVASRHRSQRAALTASTRSGTPRVHVRKTRLPVKPGDRIWTSDTRLA